MINPPSPWLSQPVSVDRATLEQAAELLEQLEHWLVRADRAAVEDCAHTCSGGSTDDPDEVAAAIGLLADRLYTRIAGAPSRWQ